MRIARYIAFRLLGVVIVLLVVTAITYVIFYLLPSNPAQLSCGKPCTPENLARAKEYLGLNLPWYGQLWEFLKGIVVGRSFGAGTGTIVCSAPCLGYSFQLSTPVTELILTHFPVTASIAVGAAVLWLVTGVLGGTIAAVRRGKGADKAIMTVAIAGVSAPAYLVGMLLILLFGFRLGWLPTGGYEPLTEDPVGWFLHLILPWCALAFISAAVYARLTRGELLEQFGQDYVRTARAKGLTERVVVVRHGLRNALIPVVTIFGLDLGTLLGGAVITERVFSMQGIGSLLITAIGTLDLQVVVGVTLFSAILIAVANVIVDIVYGIIDPRVRAA
ncbi:ABC transporter permease [Humibacter sp. RRB41]|uniref:ABC transporter permease n=1 Tax=Humibacter sp. RRB41 TaxID=2919946 RepID=UPI001FAA28CA|nr:ABC transporter permease [Humibacter sp. RRB41]